MIVHANSHRMALTGVATKAGFVKAGVAKVNIHKVQCTIFYAYVSV